MGISSDADAEAGDVISDFCLLLPWGPARPLHFGALSKVQGPASGLLAVEASGLRRELALHYPLFQHRPYHQLRASFMVVVGLRLPPRRGAKPGRQVSEDGRDPSCSTARGAPLCMKKD